MASQPNPATTLQEDVVLTLLEKYRKKVNEKKTVYGTYLECIKKYFEKDNPNCTFKDSLLQLAVQNWKEMPESRKSHYRQLNKEQHKLIDEQLDVYIQRIINARPGVRDYAGRPIIETQNESVAELTFNPLFWFLLERHAKDTPPDSANTWRDDVGKLFRDTAKSWPELSQTDQQRFINKAKRERFLYSEKNKRQKENYKAVRQILKKKLEDWIVKEL